MLRAFKIPPLVLYATVMALMVGELLCGTGVYWVTMMAITMLSIGISYNYLGGLSTLSGIIFAAFAIRTIVLSQFAKVILLEAADKNINVPSLTITGYAVFFFSAMLGIMAFSRIRLPLPKPSEPTSPWEHRAMYVIALVLGLIGALLYEITFGVYDSAATLHGPAFSTGEALRPLLLFATVIGVIMRIDKTDGRHSFGLAAFVPWLVGSYFGFVDTIRTATIMPTIAYFMTCYFKGYRLRVKHFAAGVVGIASFSLLLSPLAQYTRNFIKGAPIQDRIYEVFHQLPYAIHHRDALVSAVAQQYEGGIGSREEYFSRPGTEVLSRFSLIRADSDVFYTCRRGIRYGLTPSIIDMELAIPSFLYPNKPVYEGGQDYIGRITGMSGNSANLTAPQISAVSDSYGAFGWPGVILFASVGFPLVFIVYESMFDISKPWGLVALASCFVVFGEMMVGRFFPLVVRNTAQIVIFSRIIHLLLRTRRRRVVQPMHGRLPALGGSASE